MKKIWLLLLFLSALSCKKENGAPPALPYELIVEGGINTLSVKQFLRLTRPAALSQTVVEPVRGASVTVVTGTFDFTFTETGIPGIYSANVPNNRNYDSVYTLKISYQGRSYQAADTLRAGVPIAAAYLPLTVKRSADATISVPKHFFGVAYAQQWIIMPGDYQWDPSEFDLNDDFSYSHTYGTPNALNPLIRRERTFHAGLNDSVIIYKFSLTSAHSVYLYELFQETDWRSLLSSTPANIKGNISGNANGYFYVTDVERKKICIKDLH